MQAFLSRLSIMLLVTIVAHGSASAGLALRSSYDADESIWDIELSGDYAYLAADIEGLIILDVSDPTAPVEISRLPLGQVMRNVTVVGDRAYLPSDFLHIVDISDPSAPTLLGEIDVDGESAVVRGSHAYVASNGAMLVVDVAVPESPVIVGSLPVPEDLTTVFSVAADEQWIYVTCGQSYPHTRTILIVDVTDPTAPATVGQFTADGTYELAAAEGKVYLSNDPFTVVDVADPTQPSTISTLECAGNGVAVNGSWAYVGSWDDGGLVAIDVSDPSAPVIRSGYPIGAPLHAVAADGDLIAVTGHEDGVWFFAQDPTVAVGDGPRPAAIDLGAWPNPFNPSTTLHYTVPAAISIELVLHDVRGRIVRRLVSGESAAGAHEVVWHGCDDSGRPVPSGVYLAVLRAGEQRRTTRLSLIK